MSYKQRRNPNNRNKWKGESGSQPLEVGYRKCMACRRTRPLSKFKSTKRTDHWQRQFKDLCIDCNAKRSGSTPR